MSLLGLDKLFQFPEPEPRPTADFYGVRRPFFTSFQTAAIVGAASAATTYLQSRPRTVRCSYCDRKLSDDDTCRGCGAPK